VYDTECYPQKNYHNTLFISEWIGCRWFMFSYDNLESWSYWLQELRYDTKKIILTRAQARLLLLLCVHVHLSFSCRSCIKILDRNIVLSCESNRIGLLLSFSLTLSLSLFIHLFASLPKDDWRLMVDDALVCYTITFNVVVVVGVEGTHIP
jgi:hypothetical protein